MKRWSRWSTALAVTAAALLLVAWTPGRADDDDDDDEKKDRVVVIGGDAPRAYSYSVIGGEGGAFLGVNLKEETEYAEGGARITGIVDGSPAEESGLEEGDIIVGFSGTVIRGPAKLTEEIHAKEPGDAVTIEVIRDGKRKKIDVELGERKNRFAFLGAPGDDGDHTHFFDQKQLQGQMEKLREQMPELREQLKGLQFRMPRGGVNWFFDTNRPKLGVELVDTTDELRAFLGGDGETGVLVGRVLKGTPAEAAGVEVGDLIVGLDGDDIESTADLIEALSDKDGETFTLDVIRDKRRTSLTVTIPAIDDEDERVGPRAFAIPPAPVAPRSYRVGPVPPAPKAPPAPPAAVRVAPPAPRADLAV